MTTRRPTLALDFDGVIHGYGKGWQDGSIYDGPVPGFFDWARAAQEHFALVIHSSRTSDLFGVDAIRRWLQAQQQAHHPSDHVELELAHAKPPAWLTIDDRCVRFDGDWRAPQLQPDALLRFKPWTQRR